MRRSFDMKKKREVKNTVVEDLTIHRLEKDIMAMSQTDSMMGTGFGSKGPRRTGSMFKRQTGSSFAEKIPEPIASPMLKEPPV